MCEKKLYSGTRIDECIKLDVALINKFDKYKTLLSCCGHGKYPKTIVVHDLEENIVIEWFSVVKLSDGIRKSKKYYRKDPEGHYFIPEVTEISTTI